MEKEDDGRCSRGQSIAWSGVFSREGGVEVLSSPVTASEALLQYQPETADQHPPSPDPG